MDLTSIQTPVNVKLLIKKLQETQYDPSEVTFLEEGFTRGFDIGYNGPVERCSQADNIPLRIGTHVHLWNKLMKEVINKRVAGPSKQIPFRHYIQSPIGLIPKAGGQQTRLIFHLSYDFGPELHEKSVNFHTPEELCSVKYEDLDSAVKTCLKVKEFKMKNLRLFLAMDADGNKYIFLGKTDIKSAFRLLGLNP